LEAWELAEARIAIPGWLTTSFLLALIYLEPLRQRPTQAVLVPFERIPQAVLQGEVGAGLLFHEGAVTYREMGLYKVLDLGEMWYGETGLPLPLGLVAVRRDLGEETGRAVSRALGESIDYALAHEEEALAYALNFGRGMDRETCRRYIFMYVNQYTRDLGEEGLRALEALYRRALACGLIVEMAPLDPI